MIVYDFPQYSEAYWKERRGTATSSNASKIITPAKGELSKSAEGYCCDLIAELYDHDYGPRDEFATAAMRNGTIMEPEARRYFEFETGLTVKQVGFCRTDDRRFGCSPDGLVGDSAVLELKSPKCATQIAYLLDGGLPDTYKPQCHWHLMVTGFDVCWFMSYYPGLPPLLVKVERDGYTEKVAAAADEFWELLTNMKSQIVGQPDAVKDLAIAGANYVSPF